MKNEELGTKIKTALQEQSELYELTPQIDLRVQRALQETEKEQIKMRKFTLKKSIIAVATAVMVLGAVTVASGGVKSIISHQFNIPDYTKHGDMSTAATEAGVTVNAPEEFSNGYKFEGIYLVANTVETDNRQKIDEYTSMEVRYEKGNNIILLEVEPRPMSQDYTERYTSAIENNGITYYYNELQNKFVPVGYEPTEEEKKAMEEGNLNIGIGADEISYKISKHFVWENSGQKYLLYCMENDITEEELYNMALEIK